MDYADARKRMVDGQLRPNRVSDPRLVDAMRDLPREQFLPEALRARAYADDEVPLPGSRAMNSPLLVAKLVQLAAPRAGDRALLVCAGTGYAAALLVRCGAQVIAIEEEEPLRSLARTALAGLVPAGTVKLQDGPATAGHAAGAPYDVIMIEGEVPEVPPTIADQMAEGGRLVTVIGDGSRRGHAVLGRRVAGGLSLTPAFDCAAAALPAFARAPGFVF